MLEVEVTDNEVVIRGYTSCFYLKQLALQAALDVIGSADATRVQLNVQIPGMSATTGTDAQ
jgi:hypothetical protein